MNRATSLQYEHAGAQLPKDERTPWEKTREGLRNWFQRPSTGRTTRLGRRVEKPGEATPGGPSGQKDGIDHNRKHTNK